MAVAGPMPAPYQAGSMWRDCVHANTQGTARSASNPSLPGRTAGPRADLHARDDVDGRHRLEPLVEVGIAVHQAPVVLAAHGRHARRELQLLGARRWRRVAAPPSDSTSALKARSSVRIAIGRRP